MPTSVMTRSTTSQSASDGRLKGPMCALRPRTTMSASVIEAKPGSFAWGT